MTRIVTSLLASTAFIGLVTAAQAADMGSPLRGPAVVQPLGESSSSGGWYLRGDVGGAFSQKPDLVSEEPGVPKDFIGRSMTDAPMVSLGVGYQFTDYLRGDITADYIGNRRFHGLATYSSTYGGSPSQNYVTYDGNVRSVVLMANGYVDLGTYAGLTPYVGAGLGAAYNEISDTYTTANFYVGGVPQTPEIGSIASKGRWSFAWALHAGTAWTISPNAKFDIGYSYKNLGSVTTGEEYCPSGSCGDTLKVKNISAHTVHAGLRWTFDQTPKAPIYASPVVAKY